MLEAETCGASLSTGLTQATQPFYQHWLAKESGFAVYQVVEDLVVSRRGEVKEFFNRGLLGTRISPPLPFEIQDPKFEFGQSVLWVEV